MLSIKIDHIITLEIDIFFIEEKYLSSFNASLSLSLYNFSGNKSVEFNSIWYENDKWDQFVNGLRETPDKIDAGLTDMSGMLLLNLRSNNDRIDFNVKVNERWSNDEFINFEYQRSIDLDQFEIIRRGFIDFAKWW
jgi:hypothetical protein